MNDALRLQVEDGGEELLHDYGHLALTEGLAGVHVGEQVTA